MKAKRLNDNCYPENPGEYSKFTNETGKKYYMLMPPEEGFNPIVMPMQRIIEHTFDNITVEGPIVIAGNGSHLDYKGYLEHGEWRKCLRQY